MIDGHLFWCYQLERWVQDNEHKKVVLNELVEDDGNEVKVSGYLLEKNMEII